MILHRYIIMKKERKRKPFDWEITDDVNALSPLSLLQEYLLVWTRAECREAYMLVYYPAPHPSPRSLALQDIVVGAW